MAAVDTRGTLLARLRDYRVLLRRLLEDASLERTGEAGSVMEELLENDRALHAAKSELIRLQRIVLESRRVEEEIQQCDERIVSLAQRLGEMEEALRDSVSKEADSCRSTCKQKFSVHDVTVFAEKLALMSFAPADYLEMRGLAIHRPPAPLENLMNLSLLNRGLSDLLDFAADDARAISEPQTAGAVRLGKRRREEPSAEVEAAVVTGPQQVIEEIAGVAPPPDWRPGDPVKPEHLTSIHLETLLPEWDASALRTAPVFEHSLNPQLEDAEEGGDKEHEEESESEYERNIDDEDEE